MPSEKGTRPLFKDREPFHAAGQASRLSESGTVDTLDCIKKMTSTFLSRRTLLALTTLGALSTLTPRVALALSIGTQKNVPLVQPSTVTFPVQNSLDAVRESLVEVASRLHWRVLCQTQPGHVHLVYLRGDRLELEVDISYTLESFTIHYVGSRGLYEEKTKAGDILLRPKGNTLINDLNRVLTRRMTTGLPAPTPGEHEEKKDDGKAGDSDSSHSSSNARAQSHGAH